MNFEHINDELVIPINIKMAQDYFNVLEEFKRNKMASKDFADFCCLALGKILEPNRITINNLNRKM